MIPGPGMGLGPTSKAPKAKPKKSKPACRCEPSPAAKKAAAGKKATKAAARNVPRSARGPLHLGGTVAPHHQKTAAKTQKAHGRPAALRGGGGKARVPAGSAPATHAKAETHCQCKKTSTPRPRGHVPRR